ncbi:IS5 family transposase, partial [Luteimicrobium xylanilyticum]
EPVHNEPAGHGIGRSRGGLTTKVHHAVDGRGRPLAAVVTAGQCHDGQQLKAVLADVWVPREVGRPRTTPDALLADKAYSSAATRADLRARRIQAVIPERADQKANRKRKGSAGGRPPVTDFEKYKKRNVVERSFNLLKQWRALATRYDKHATIYRGAVVLAAIIVWLRS